MFVAVFKDIVISLYQPFIFAVLFSYMCMYFYMFSEYSCETGKGVYAAISTWLYCFSAHKKFRMLFIFIFYITIIVFKTLLNRNIWPDPFFDVIGEWWVVKINHKSGRLMYNLETIENLVMLMPFSVLLLSISEFRKNHIILMNLLYGMLYTFTFSCLIEILQVIFRLGTFQISDLFFNTLVGVVGEVLFTGCCCIKSFIASKWAMK